MTLDRELPDVNTNGKLASVPNPAFELMLLDETQNDATDEVAPIRKRHEMFEKNPVEETTTTVTLDAEVGLKFEAIGVTKPAFSMKLKDCDKVENCLPIVIETSC